MKNALSTYLLAAFSIGTAFGCSGGNNNPDVQQNGDSATNVDDMVTSHDVHGPGDSGPTGPVSNVCAAPIDISNVAPSADGKIHYIGNTQDTLIIDGPFADPACFPGGSTFHQLALHYRMQTTAGLWASTVNTNTDPAFDNNIMLVDACSNTAHYLGCNNDTSATEISATVSSNTALTAGQDVYIIVSGLVPMGSHNVAEGEFEITVREIPPAALGDTCGPGVTCPANSHCLLTPSQTSSTCQPDGTAGGFCRAMAPQCDPMLTCASTTGIAICRSTVMAGAMCDPEGRLTACATPAACAYATTDQNGTCLVAVPEQATPHGPDAPQGAVTTSTVYSASFATGTDNDCYGITLTAPASLIIRTGDGTGGCPGNMADTVVHLFQGPAMFPPPPPTDGGVPGSDGGDAAAPDVVAITDGGSVVGAELTMNDDINFPTNTCSLIDGLAPDAMTGAASPAHALPVGNYVVCVNPFSQGGPGMTIPLYYLDISIVP